MNVPFVKYHGCGNDFILVDNRALKLSLDKEEIEKLCHRRFGIGSDGIILIQDEKGVDYHMVFFNPDGSQSFCGNGSRCAIHFCQQLGIIQEKASFKAIDGIHEGQVQGKHTSIHMGDVTSIECGADYYYLNTGSPHYVQFVEDLDQIDVFAEGRKIRYNDRFKEVGTNVNFVQLMHNRVKSRVYERGVENETFSSGTGSTAVALAAHVHALNNLEKIEIDTKGGTLSVEFKKQGNHSFDHIWLNGPVEISFEGTFVR